MNSVENRLRKFYNTVTLYRPTKTVITLAIIILSFASGAVGTVVGIAEHSAKSRIQQELHHVITNDLHSVQEHYDEALANIAALEENLTQTVEELDALQGQAAALQTENAELGDMYNETAGELNATAEELAALQTENAELGDMYNATESELNAILAVYDELQGNLTASEAMYNESSQAYEDEIARLNNKIRRLKDRKSSGRKSPNPSFTVKITDPEDGDIVEAWLDLCGTYTGTPPHEYIWILARDTVSGKYYPQSRVPFDGLGGFVQPINLEGDSGNTDQEFEIVVAKVDAEVDGFYFWYLENKEYEKYGLDLAPNAVILASVTVTRHLPS